MIKLTTFDRAILFELLLFLHNQPFSVLWHPQKCIRCLFRALFWVGDHNFTKNGFVTTEAPRASCELIFYASESWDRWLSNECRFIPQFAILCHKMAKNFRTPENIQFDHAFLKLCVVLRFKHFSWSGKSCKNFWQRFVSTKASRASCELIFYASESWDRWLSNAYRFIPQFAILRHKMEHLYATYFWGIVFGSISGSQLKTALRKMHFLARINGAVNFGCQNNQNVSAINSNHPISDQKGINAINVVATRNSCIYGTFPKTPLLPKMHFMCQNKSLPSTHLAKMIKIRLQLMRTTHISPKTPSLLSQHLWAGLGRQFLGE